ncbi:type I-E CRISPR-associated protein Cse2/CasB [Streptomyces sp. CAU 1734]|uniref:type I-E CRISPR-associated protein Cse2/CasB n=1 Tax=Streptomyces sp. CAU 1734 TaxID=3140360 RepID=UPI0032608054
MTTTGSGSVRRLRPYFWETFSPGQPYAARDIAALRAGVGREPGAVRGMRRLYRAQVFDEDRAAGQESAGLAAEHVALTLFGVHQQGRPRSVHRAGAGLGAACRVLRGCGQVSPIAVDRRMEALAGSLSSEELAHHLRPLVQLLRGAGIGLDYTRLLFDVRAWQQTEAEQNRRVRAWGLQYRDLARTDPGAPGPHLGASGEECSYWERYTPGASRAAAELAALRAGADREAGTVPAMWNLYRAEVSPYEQSTGALGSRLVAEHMVLVLFGLHQHGRRKVMHLPGMGLGTACGRLRDSGRGSAEGLERRFGNVLTAVDGHELGRHVRGLVSLLRVVDQPLDYSLLERDLLNWDVPGKQAAIRSRWDRTFHFTGSPSR